MYHIHGMSLSFNTTKVIYVAEELGVDFKYTVVDLSKGENKSPEHMARHPLGKLPTLDHDGKKLFESAAICQYMAAAEKSPLLPTDIYQRALVDQWMNYMSIHLGRWIGSLLFERYVRKAFGMGEINKDAEKEALGFIEQQMAVVDKQLAANKFIAGDALTIADPHAFAYIETAPMCELSLEPYPNVQRWLDTYAARPAANRAQERLGRNRSNKAAV